MATPELVHAEDDFGLAVLGYDLAVGDRVEMLDPGLLGRVVRFLAGQISFMLARPQQPPPFGVLPDLDSGEERTAPLGPHVLDDWNTRFVAQLAVPRAQHVTLTPQGRTEHLLIDVAVGAWALLYEDSGAWIVRQGGPDRLWDAVEAYVTRWRGDGASPLERVRDQRHCRRADRHLAVELAGQPRHSARSAHAGGGTLPYSRPLSRIT